MRGEGLGASVDCQASVDTSTSLAPDTTSSAASSTSSAASASTSSAASAAEDAKVQAEKAIAEASAAKETAEAVSSALADVDSLLASLLAQKRRQEATRAVGLEATSVAGGISPPTSCAAFAHMMDQVSLTSFLSILLDKMSNKEVMTDGTNRAIL